MTEETTKPNPPNEAGPVHDGKDLLIRSLRATTWLQGQMATGGLYAINNPTAGPTWEIHPHPMITTGRDEALGLGDDWATAVRQALGAKGMNTGEWYQECMCCCQPPGSNDMCPAEWVDDFRTPHCPTCGGNSIQRTRIEEVIAAPEKDLLLKPPVETESAALGPCRHTPLALDDGTLYAVEAFGMLAIQAIARRKKAPHVSFGRFHVCAKCGVVFSACVLEERMGRQAAAAND